VPFVPRQDRPVQHVRVGQQVAGVAAGPLPLGIRAVAVEGGDPEPGEVELDESPGLVVAQGLGG
jgi:hypothetical protein